MKNKKNGVTLIEVIVGLSTMIFVLWNMASHFGWFSGDPFSYDSFTDSRDGQTYKTVKIGEQTWMAENLRFKTENSICFLNDERECSKGRFYPITDVNNIRIEYEYKGFLLNFEKKIKSVYLGEDKKICPDGWHLPNTREASILINELTTQSGDNYYMPKSPTNVFWGQGMGLYIDSEFKNGIGTIKIGHWLISDGKYVTNQEGSQRIHSVSLEIIDSKFNIRCIADKK